MDGKGIVENASIDATLSTVRNSLAPTARLQALVPDDLNEGRVSAGVPARLEYEIALQIAPEVGVGAMAMATSIRRYDADTNGMIGVPGGSRERPGFVATSHHARLR